MPIRSITIDFISSKQQRYNTVGDWLFDGFGNLHIKVTESGDIMRDLPIAIHELIEAVLCNVNGITQDQVDQWDLKDWNLIEWITRQRKYDEPGDHPDAPYHKEHIVATYIEQDMYQFGFLPS